MSEGELEFERAATAEGVPRVTFLKPLSAAISIGTLVEGRSDAVPPNSQIPRYARMTVWYSYNT